MIHTLHSENFRSGFSKSHTLYKSFYEIVLYPESFMDFIKYHVGICERSASALNTYAGYQINALDSACNWLLLKR